MSYITRNLRGTVTYWAPGVNDGFGGVTFPTSVNIKSRWEDKSELFVDASGNEVVSKARVYLASDVVLEGYLFNGESTASDPNTVSDAYEIRAFRKTPNLRGTVFERRVML